MCIVFRKAMLFARLKRKDVRVVGADYKLLITITIKITICKLIVIMITITTSKLLLIMSTIMITTCKLFVIMVTAKNKCMIKIDITHTKH